MKRKLISIGYTTLVSLPKHWLELKGIEKGQFVEITINENGHLVIKNENE